MRSTATAFVAVSDVRTRSGCSRCLRARRRALSSFELLPRIAIELALRHIEGVANPLDWQSRPGTCCAS
jgi:hypothetical protein